MASSNWPREAQRFHTASLRPEQESVREHFRYAHILYAGSYEGCGCGFNYGRQYPDLESDAEHLNAARESVAELVKFVRDSGVREIYTCRFDDESKPTVQQRTISSQSLAAPDFFFREHELLNISPPPYD